MPAPIDYGVQIADPTQAFLSAFQAGTSIQDAQFKQQQQVQQAEQQRMIQAGFAKLQSPNATAADYANLSMMLPETQAKAVRESFGMLDSERQKTALSQASQVFSAFKSGKPEIAIGLMDQQITAKQNAGDTEGANFLKTWRDVAKENPQATENYFGYIISEIPGGDKIITSAIALGGESRAAALAKPILEKAVADAGAAVSDAKKKLAEAEDTPARLLLQQDLTSAQTALQRAQTAASKGEEARKITKFIPEFAALQATATIKQIEAKYAPDKFLTDLNLTKEQIEQAKAARKASDAAAKESGAKATRLEAEAAQMALGIIPVEKRPEVESKFRKEYNDQTQTYQTVKSAYGRVLSSEDSAVGDLSLIFGYMKMLDPGSVVREGEFATAQNATGVPERIINIYNKLITGERLNSSQRNSFKGQAKGLYNSALEGEKTIRTGLDRIAKGYGLNTANIFYTPTEVEPTAQTAQAAPPATAPPAAPAAATRPAAGQRNVTVDY